TGGMESAQEPDEEMLLSIINTIYYSDEWIDKFDKKNTAEDDFYLSDGTTVRCDFLNSHNISHGFTRGEGYTRSSLSLKNNAEMVFVLPDEEISIYELVDTPGKLSKCFEEGENYCGEVIWQIPKFSNDSKLDLKNTLMQLGIKEAFNEAADFSEIGNAKNELNNPYISTVIQNTHIEIDEKGVTASAFTQIFYAGAALPTDRADMILDRPFLYAVVNAQGVILFIGICENPVP
ncbi:MAG: serpin family protein, partial [Lachnospiraceae bacterium]